MDFKRLFFQYIALLFITSKSSIFINFVTKRSEFMRSTFSVLFYTKNQSLKDGRVPIMGRITINRTTACFSCKLEVSLALWDAKANRAKGKSDEARRLNQKLDHIKAQITRHYQYICDHDSLVTAKSVYNRYLGFGDSYHTLMGLFREELASYKEKVGKEKAASTYRGLVADYNNLLLFLKEKRRIEDIAIADLDKKFIEDYYNWMLGTCALASSTAFCRVNTLKWLMYTAQERGWIKLHPFIGFDCLPEYKRRSFLTEEDLQRVIHVKLNYKRQRAIRDMFLFMCFTGLAYADLKEITYKNIHTDSEGGTWLMGNRIKTGVSYVVKLLPVEKFGYDAIFFILLILCFAWGGDTCAYFAGRAFGKHKLCPVVSPKKTVEGAVGGVLGTMVFGVLVTVIYSVAADRMEAFTRSNIGVSMYIIIALLACVAAVLGIYGDLFASVVKRQCGIKDYGTIFPGHGGILDRFDSVMFIAPFVTMVVIAVFYY